MVHIGDGNLTPRVTTLPNLLAYRARIVGQRQPIRNAKNGQKTVKSMSGMCSPSSDEAWLHIPLILLTVFWPFLALRIGCRCPTILAL